MIEIVTYKELKEKYPNATEDLERLRISKIHALNGTRIFFFLLGIVVCYFTIGYFHIFAINCNI